MLGYSDSAKDACSLAANLALYQAQGRLAAWAADRGIDLLLFHGRGGALGRGGGPAGRAVRGQAPGSVAGRFKVTEQGEVIYARYGNLAIGHRHLEQVTNAVLGASTPLSPRRPWPPPRTATSPPPPPWRRPPRRPGGAWSRRTASPGSWPG